MLSFEEHIDNLVRHIELVREAGLLLAKRLANRGQKDFARMLLANIFVHDASKFSGIEWDYLHSGDCPVDKLQLAIKSHVQTNLHHPEAWGGFNKMPDIFLAELTCDWYARAQEFGTGLKDWIRDEAIDKFQIDINSDNYKKVMEFVDLLLVNYFSKGTE